jgi:hypothetical protein
MQSIGDFAENLINEQVGSIRSGKQLPPTSQSNGMTPAGKDISNVEVPDSFMKEVLGEAFHPQDTPAVEEIPELVWEQPEEPQTSQALTEETAQQLVPLLEEVRDLLKEMGTTAGMMGVNLGGPGKDNESWEKMEKGYGYKKSKASNLPNLSGKKSKKAVLKASIRSKLKRNK